MTTTRYFPPPKRYRNLERVRWRNMIARCENPKNPSFPQYGGRGVKVCERWRASFDAFRKDMGAPPSPEHSLDRVDADGDYEPENCRWATAKDQARNQRRNRLLTFCGDTMCVTEWAERTGIKASVINQRLALGWTAERALSEPTHERRWGRRPVGQ